MEQPICLSGRASGEAGQRFAVGPWRAFGDQPGWDALAARAAEPNPFAERWCLEAGLKAFAPSGAVLLATLHVDGVLVGLMPIARRWHYERYPLPHIGNWSHANAFLGAPLVAAGHEHAFWRGLLAHADTHAGRALFLHLHTLPMDGPTFTALREVCLVERRPAAIVQRHERALLASDLSPSDYFDASLSGKKRKELRRQFTRLSEHGAVAHERRDDDAGLDTWADAFLALEKAGWKGAAGSAFASDPVAERFFRDALSGAAAMRRLERLAITLDGRPIAMLANFLTPPGAFSFKTTYDERYARFSPGVLLQRENLALLDRTDIAWTDSCASADHPMIERIWREKRTIARVSIAIGGPLRRAIATRIFHAETGVRTEGL